MLAWLLQILIMPAYAVFIQYNIGVVSVASGIMAMQYQDILAINSFCLIPFLFGETETGIAVVKMIIIHICLSFYKTHMGNYKDQVMSGGW